MATTKKQVTPKASKGKGFSAEEKAAARERVKEIQLGKGATEDEVLEKIAAMDPSDRAMATRVHRIIRAAAPALTPRLWYGMPSYYKGAKNICFFQDARKFKARYATLGFNDGAMLDDGEMWPVAYALRTLTPADEAKVASLVKKAAG